MYEHILVPLDGSHESESSLAYVEVLAGHQPTKVTVLQVASTDVELTDPKHQIFLHKLEQNAVNQARHYVEYVAGVLEDESVSAQAAVAFGRPADKILEQAAATSADLVVMMSRGRSGFDRLTHGSVAWELRHRLTVPMLVVPAGPHAQVVQPWGDEAHVSDVVLPLDGSPLAEQAVPHANAMAARFGANVSLIRVVTRPTMAAIEPEALAYYFELEAELATTAEQYLQEQAARFDAGIEVTTKVVRGLPADALLQHVESLERPMVVMTTHGRSGLGRVVLGSVAEKVTQASGDPVLLVRAQ